MVHPTFRVMRQSCNAYSLNLKYFSSLKPYALRFITLIGTVVSITITDAYCSPPFKLNWSQEKSMLKPFQYSQT